MTESFFDRYHKARKKFEYLKADKKVKRSHLAEQSGLADGQVRRFETGESIHTTTLQKIVTALDNFDNWPVMASRRASPITPQLRRIEDKLDRVLNILARDSVEPMTNNEFELRQ